MTPYVDYDYYNDTYKGTVIPDATAFNDAVQKASVWLRYYTFDKIKDPVPDDAKDACCAIADNYYNTEDEIKKSKELLDKTGGVKSENTDGYSITYASTDEVRKQVNNLETNLDKNNVKIARKYLLHTGLLYRGLC